MVESVIRTPNTKHVQKIFIFVQFILKQFF